MFETLDQKIEQVEGEHVTTKQKMLRLLGLLVITVVFFAALFVMVRGLE